MDMPLAVASERASTLTSEPQSVEDCDFVPERAAHIRVLLSQAKQQYPFSDSLSTQRPVNSTSLVLFPRVNLIGGISTYCQAEGKTENPPSPARLMPLGARDISSKLLQ